MTGSHRPFDISARTLHLLHRAGQVVEVLFEKRLDLELTARQFIVLAVVADSSHPSQASLCNRTGIDRSTMADIVGRLVQRGLLSRTRAQYDARMYEIQVTAAGRDVLNKAMPVADEVDELLLGAFTEAEKAALTMALKRMTAVMEGAEEAA